MKIASRTITSLFAIVVSGVALAQTTPAAPPGTAPPRTTPPPSTPPAAATPAPAAATPPSAAPAAATAPATATTTGGDMEGLAAVYSDKLAGHKTASGQVFSQSKLTAAHPSLAFGTRVKVTNTKNNKSVEVTINDRGPTQAGRVIDMSSAAAAKIALRKTTMVPVKLEVVAEAPPKKATK
jgi:rare lipoprotein A